MNSVYQFFDLPKTLFYCIFFIIMICGCYYIICPFIMGFLWASMMVISTWPILIRFQKIFWNQRYLAVIAMILLLLLLFIVPIVIIITSVMESSALLLNLATKQKEFSFFYISWLHDIPIIGTKLYNFWKAIILDGSTSIISKIQPYIGKSAGWLFGRVTILGSFLLQCCLIIFFGILLYSQGEKVAYIIQKFINKLDEQRSNEITMLIVQTIRAVALGIILTAIVQSLLCGIGLTLIGIPFSTVFTIIIFIFCIVQLGALPILIPIIIWLYWNEQPTSGTILLIWSVIVVMLDNILRPIFIRIGIDLPIILVLFGVFGGLLAFGMIGLFLGPIILSVSYRLFISWIEQNS